MNRNAGGRSRIRDALFVIGAPRSGTTILQRSLAMHQGFWGLYGESHAVFEGPFRPDLTRGESNRVTAAQLTPILAAQLREKFWRRSLNLPLASGDPTAFTTTGSTWDRIWKRGRAIAAWTHQNFTRPEEIHLLEKTPKNALRVPMLAALVPNARFVFLARRPEPTVDSLIEGWHTWERVGPFGRRLPYGTYRMAGRLAPTDYAGEWWNFVLFPGWEAFLRRSVPEIAAAQYAACVRTAADDLATLPVDRRLVVRYEDLLARPAEVVERILDFAGLEMTDPVARFARSSIAPPRQERGLRHAASVKAQSQTLAEADAHFRAQLPEAAQP